MCYFLLLKTHVILSLNHLKFSLSWFSIICACQIAFESIRIQITLNLKQFDTGQLSLIRVHITLCSYQFNLSFEYMGWGQYDSIIYMMLIGVL